MNRWFVIWRLGNYVCQDQDEGVVGFRCIGEAQQHAQKILKMGGYCYATVAEAKMTYEIKSEIVKTIL